MNAIKLRLSSLGSAGAMLALVALAQPARAQWIVNDPPHQIQNIITQLRGIAKDSSEYQQQYQRWMQTYAHYQQQLIKMQGLMKSFQLPAGRPMKEVDPDHLVAERCGGGFSLAGALTTLAPARQGDYIAQQRSICAEMQRIRNRKFNETVRFTRDTVPRMQRDANRAQEVRQSSTTQGDNEAAAQMAVQTMSQVGSDMAAWGARMDGYDQLLGILQDTQKQLAQMALDGNKDPIGTLVKTGALQGALKVGN